MKKLLTIAFILILASCSKEDSAEDCESIKAEIRATYQVQIDWVMENTDPVDIIQIGLLQAERDNKLRDACN